MIDVLMYLFENYMDDDHSLQPPNQGRLKTHLTAAGFDKQEINKAFHWLSGLTDQQQQSPQPQVSGRQTIRIYTPQEKNRLDNACRGYMQYLEQIGALSSAIRETVIDRAMALDVDHIDLDKLKWVILMVLFNQADSTTNPSWMGDLLFAEPETNIH